MNKAKLIIAAVLILGVVLVSIEARPKYMRRYNADPKAKAQYKNKCTMCHIGKGGEENTQFGLAFDDAGHQFTPDLRAQYPRYFRK